MSTKYFILIFLQLFNLLSQLFVYEIPRRRPLKVLNYSKLALYESEWPSFLIIYIRSMWCLITFWFSALRLLPFLNKIFIYFFPIFQVSKFQIAMKWNIGKSFLHKAAKMTHLVRKHISRDKCGKIFKQTIFFFIFPGISSSLEKKHSTLSELVAANPPTCNLACSER